ncbi:MAG: 4a-hydroxytetrahydrobiopterin dehydratase [Bacteriovoracaceae bacterium]|nr:4a-hydroxytetrahydrobiopterin dehydratase [Bacteriovoracaceae bacterium]
MNIEEKLKSLEGWIYDNNSKSIKKEFLFKSYLKTIAFVNAVAWIANKENHHPDLEVSFNKCLIKLTTHDEGGVSEQDFKLALAINCL